MVKIYLCLTLWIFSTFNWPFTIARLRKGDTSDHEHVHIKVHVPEVLRKHTHGHYKTQRLTHPHFVKRFPLHYANVDVDVDNDEDDTHAIFEPYDLEQPAPLPLLTSEHEFLAHMGAAVLPLANNDIINNNQRKKQQRQQKQPLQPQIRLPAIIPPTPLPLPLPMTVPIPMPVTQALYATEADSFATHSNTNNYEPHNDDFLTDLQQQQLYMNSNNNDNTLTSTLLSGANVNKKNKKKKRKRITITNTNDYNFKDNSHKYYVNEQQEEEYGPQLRQTFQPYISTNQPYGNSYGNSYKNNIYLNEDSSNYGKKYKLSSIGPSFAAAFAADASNIDVNVDVENSSEEAEQDINEDVDSAFKASFQQPTESASVEHYHRQLQPGKSLTQAFGGSTGNGFSPVSYQQLFATYAATPATNHLSTQPTRLKFKRQHPIQQPHLQSHAKQVRQQFVQLSSMAPIVAADIDGFHSTVLAPITTNKIYEPISNIHTQPTNRIKQRYTKRKNRIKVKRNRL